MSGDTATLELDNDFALPTYTISLSTVQYFDEGTNLARKQCQASRNEHTYHPVPPSPPRYDKKIPHRLRLLR